MASLAERLAARIRQAGPLTVADYMAVCLGDPVDGYYRRADPFGRGGDFVTAPEISQIFGELIGAWCVAVWERSGAPARFVLAELGPGRGTLMADALRAARLRPAFLAAAEMHLVETSPVLRRAQEAALSGSGMTPVWHDDVSGLPAGPLIAIANEFFDTLPIHQHVRVDRGWAERMVGIDEGGRLVFALGPAIAVRPAGMDAVLAAAAAPGAVFERNPAAEAIVARLAGRVASEGGAVLAIDYGHGESGLGDTLQAVRAHAYADPLADPGSADLTAHVDFASLRRAAEEAGAAVAPLLAQGEFLRRLGLDERAAALARGKPAPLVAEIMAGAERLSGAQTMGTLFKVLAIGPRGLTLPAFDSPGSDAQDSGDG